MSGLENKEQNATILNMNVAIGIKTTAIDYGGMIVDLHLQAMNHRHLMECINNQRYGHRN